MKNHHLSEKVIIQTKKRCYRMMFYDKLRARYREREEKGTTNSVPISFFMIEVQLRSKMLWSPRAMAAGRFAAKALSM